MHLGAYSKGFRSLERVREYRRRMEKELGGGSAMHVCFYEVLRNREVVEGSAKRIERLVDEVKRRALAQK